jgi:DtxR family Mn-dependent transcriptional regulator
MSDNELPSNDLTSSHSQSVEDFLKAVYVLQVHESHDENLARVSTTALAEALNILPPSVTDMARRMADAGLVDYKRYYGVRLTTQGETVALKVIRRHRLIETYLVEHLAYALHEVHDEAERLEHAVSDRFIEAIAWKLDYPTFDPHGDPIPTVDGEISTPDLVSLADLGVGGTGIVSRFIADKDDMLQHIINRGFQLGVVVHVTDVDPFEGPITVHINGIKSVIGYSVARSILLERTAE